MFQNTNLYKMLQCMKKLSPTINKMTRETVIAMDCNGNINLSSIQELKLMQ